MSHNPTLFKRQAKNRKMLKMLGNVVVLTALSVFFLFPLVFMFVSSLKGDESQVLRDMSSIKALIPYGSLSLQNYHDVFERVNYPRAFFNSVLVVSLTVLLGLLINSAFAYALARLRFGGRNIMLTLVIALMIIPFEAVAVPLLLLVNKLPWFDGSSSWLNSYHVQILPFAAHAFSIYLFYQFFISLPNELEEAALVDGASRFRIYWNIVLPLSGPVFATVAILQFLARWGDLLWAVMAVRGDEFAPLPLAMQTFFGQAPRQWGDVMAFAAMTTLPTLLVFLSFQRWFVRSVVSSGVKG